ncbi:MAG: UDP-N-acetylmuramoyl-tripeptide--D-alanyl-D-alanine ligase [Oscillospiraceae bacterium]|jgi:UDP-N-acetylmuramoyl-tripeptide--D-alanyl-D-alanine ligase|nr:UDP-N-acetylmuramoyl-tripeptide--D-alanyl-D-alanine ligase [Oscillospiraceae bacterium]
MDFVVYLLRILFFLVSLCGTAVGARHFLHMFQLNSYKPNVQRRWLNENQRQALLLWLPAAGGFLFWPKAAKVPLKMTSRAKRLVAAYALLTVLWYALAWRFAFPLGLEFFFFWIWQSNAPYVLLAANWLNRPIEAAVRRHYTGEAVRKLRSHPSLIVIGITGSYGKTSVKHYLNTLLRAKYNVLITPGGVNTPMGVVRCVREELSAAHEIFLCEMGAKNRGDIKELCDLVQPQHGILTAVGPQHLESFGAIETIIATKFELADALPPHGTLFANIDSEPIAKTIGSYPNTITYSAGSAGSYHAKDRSVNENGTSFTFVTPQGDQERFTSRLIGAHNIVNLVGAAAAAHALGVPLEQLKGQMRKIAPVPHRLELIDRGDVLVIDDGYNSNPAGAKAALDTLALFEGLKILVTPGMIELGARQAQLNYIFGLQAAAVCDVIALIGPALTKPIYDGAIEGGFPPEQIIVANALPEAIAQVNALSAPRKVILLENDLPDNFDTVR